MKKYIVLTLLLLSSLVDLGRCKSVSKQEEEQKGELAATDADVYNPAVAASQQQVKPEALLLQAEKEAAGGVVGAESKVNQVLLNTDKKSLQSFDKDAVENDEVALRLLKAEVPPPHSNSTNITNKTRTARAAAKNRNRCSPIESCWRQQRQQQQQQQPSSQKRAFHEYDEAHEYEEYDDGSEAEDLGYEYHGGHSEHGGHGGHGGYAGELFRDVAKQGQSKVVRNPRDNRFFPGNQPAGIAGVTPKLLQFIQGHVNQISFEVQGPPPSREDYP